jgi:hypothetical protein
MTRDPLEQLLRNSDADASPPPAPPPDLAARVVRLAHMRRRRRLTAGAIAAGLLLIASLTIPLWRSRPHPSAAPGAAEPIGPAAAKATRNSTTDTDALAAQVADLVAEADWRAAVAHRTAELQARQSRLATLAATSARSNPVYVSQRAADEAAGTLFVQGDRLYREYRLPQRAADSYREVLRLFPQTTWAGLSRARLAELAKTEGDWS